MVSAKKKMNVDVSTASEKTSWSYVKLESKADVEATKIPVPESEFVVPKFIARECEDNVTITYQINGETVECHDGVITLKKEKHFAKTIFGYLLALVGVIIAIMILGKLFKYNAHYSDDAIVMPETGTIIKSVTETTNLTNDVWIIEPNTTETTGGMTMDPTPTLSGDGYNHSYDQELGEIEELGSGDHPTNSSNYWAYQ